MVEITRFGSHRGEFFSDSRASSALISLGKNVGNGGVRQRRVSVVKLPSLAGTG
jgi:hypothetical protein